jgi:hypothetical protein
MSTRFINCEVCQTEGRLLTNDGGPDDVDHGVCPVCNGEFVVEVETQPIDPEDIPDYDCENCIGMIEHGCYCRAVGAVGPGGPLRSPQGSAYRAASLWEDGKMGDIIERLRERAKTAREEKTGTADGDAIHFEEAAREIERLRGALAPFAAVAKFVTETQRDTRPIIFGMDNVIVQRLTVGHLRGAHAALTPAKPDEDVGRRQDG